MKKTAIHFLQFVVLLFGLFSLILLLRFPLLEGRAVNLTLFEIYSDPFILYVYLSSIAFYLALLELVKLLKYIGEDRLFFYYINCCDKKKLNFVLSSFAFL